MKEHGRPYSLDAQWALQDCEALGVHQTADRRNDARLCPITVEAILVTLHKLNSSESHRVSSMHSYIFR